MPGRLRHIESENRRVLDVVAALRDDDLRRSPRSSGRPSSLRVDFEVTTPELDRLVELAYANGPSRHG